MTWNDYYALAEKYYRRHGNLATPSTYWCMGENLGAWLSRQRVCYLPDAPHPLTQYQVELLDMLNMNWEINYRDWETCFGYAERYFAEHGNLHVLPGKLPDGFDLYTWLAKQRAKYALFQESEHIKSKKQGKPLTAEQISRLESIGMLWNSCDYAWERSFAVAERYYKEHGNLSVPKNFEMDGVNLSHWIWAQRRFKLGTDSDRKQRLTEEQVQRLESIGMDWAPKSKGFSYYYQMAEQFYHTYGHTDFPKGAVEINGEILAESGETLSAWKADQQQKFTEKKYDMKWEHIMKLREIGIISQEALSPWEKNYRAAKAYYKEHGDLLVPFSYRNEDGIRLGRWISTQRMKRNGTAANTLTEEQIRRLDAIGMVWNMLH